MEEEYSTVPLHYFPEYKRQCCTLLNSEWPRSETARMRSIENSNDNLPMSLLLVKTPRKVIGHARISRLPRDPEGCWIESVVVCPSVRGKGLGRVIMTACNDVASKLGFKYLYLSTHDQQGFYTKLGYELCEPVCHFGAGTLPIPQPSISKTHNQKDNHISKYRTEDDTKNIKNVLNTKISISGPVPPPLPSTELKKPLITKTFLKKAVQI